MFRNLHYISPAYTEFIKVLFNPLQEGASRLHYNSGGTLRPMSVRFIMCFHSAYSITKQICNLFELPHTIAIMVNLEPLGP